MREQLVGKGQVQEYERDSVMNVNPSTVANHNSTNFNHNNTNFNHNSTNFNRQLPQQQNEISLPASNYSSNSGLRDDGDGNNSPSKRRYRRMETITATTFKMTPNQGRLNNMDHEYDHRQLSVLPAAGQRYQDLGQLTRRYQDPGQLTRTPDFNTDNNRFNYVEDDQYQRANRNINQSSSMLTSHHNNSNNQALISNQGFPSNKLKRPLPRGQFFD